MTNQTIRTMLKISGVVFVLAMIGLGYYSHQVEFPPLWDLQNPTAYYRVMDTVKLGTIALPICLAIMLFCACLVLVVDYIINGDDDDDNSEIKVNKP